MLWLSDGVVLREGGFGFVSCEARELRLDCADGALLCSPFVSGMMARAYSSFTTVRLLYERRIVVCGDVQLYLCETPGGVGTADVQV